MENVKKLMRKSKHNRHGNSVSRKIVFSVAFILFALYALLFKILLQSIQPVGAIAELHRGNVQIPVFAGFAPLPRSVACHSAHAKQAGKTRYKYFFQSTFHYGLLLLIIFIDKSAPCSSHISINLFDHSFSPPKYTFSIIVFWKTTNKINTGISESITPAK